MRVEQFLAAHPKLHLHYTPTYSSWLNQVENWLARIERDVIARGDFTSVKDLKRKLMRYIRHYNKAPKPIKWTYRDPSHRITTASTVTGNLVLPNRHRQQTPNERHTSAGVAHRENHRRWNQYFMGGRTMDNCATPRR